MIDVSIILVNFNTCQLTIQAITSIYKYTNRIKFEIIVVDNNSNDNSVEQIQFLFPEIRIIKNNKNIGFGRANNEGIKIAKGEYIFLLNTDAYLLNNAIEIFYDFMENQNNEDAAVVGGTLCTPDEGWNVSFGYFPNFKRFVKGSFWRHFFRKSFYQDSDFTPIVEDDINPFLVDYVSGADFFIRKKVLDKVGLFDNSFFMYFEETELTCRIKKRIKNAKVYMIPQARIVHIGKGSSLESTKGVKFKLQYLKSKSNYFRIQDGPMAGFMVYTRGLVTVFFNY
jgi:GT2 family glycosyltransferase